MNKALIEKAFEKWLESKRIEVSGDSSYLFQDAFAGGATWQREQLDKYKAKDLLDEIHTSYMRYHAENYDTKDFVINLACGSVVVMDKQGYQELKKEREQLEAEIKELKTKLNAIYDKDNEAQTKLNDAIDVIQKIKTEMPTAYQDYDGVCQATEHLCIDFLAKLDLLEGIK